MTTCKSFRIFYEPDAARWSSSENLFILIKKLFEKMKLLVILLILKICIIILESTNCNFAYICFFSFFSYDKELRKKNKWQSLGTNILGIPASSKF